MLPSLYALPFCDLDLRASHERTLLHAALASVPFGFVLVRVRVPIQFIARQRIAIAVFVEPTYEVQLSAAFFPDEGPHWHGSSPLGSKART